jgi:hypothetical protein
MITAPNPAFVTVLRRELVTYADATPTRRRRRRALVIAGTALLFVGGGAAAVAGLRPAGDRADQPLAPPYIVSGVGPATVPLPPAPVGATYALVELTCFDSTRCLTPGGGGGIGPSTDVQPITSGGPLPLTDAFDPHNAQVLDPIDPAVGVAVDVDAGSHWRLYAVYADRIDPTIAIGEDGTAMGMRGLEIPTMVPITMTDGGIGWVSFDQLTVGATVTLTSTGVLQAPLTAYGPDGVTVIGEADVSRALASQ